MGFWNTFKQFGSHAYGDWKKYTGAGKVMDLVSGAAGSMDRSKRAEEMYGGVNSASMGVPGFDKQYANYGQLSRSYGQQDPYFSGFRGGQQSLGRTLAAEAQGQGVGQQLVGMQARTAADRASAQQFGAIAGARPGMQAMASRNAMLGSALAQSAVGEQAALGSAQMTLGAQNAYGNFLQGARGQDEANVMAQRQLNNQSQLQALQQRQQLAGMQQSGGISAEQLRAQRYAALMGAPTQGEIIAGGVTGLASTLFGRGK